MGVASSPLRRRRRGGRSNPSVTSRFLLTCALLMTSSHSKGRHATDNILLLRPNTAPQLMKQLPLRMTALIRDELKKQPMPWKAGTPAVAFHMRRGDVGCASKERYDQTAIGNGFGDPSSENFRLVHDDSWLEFLELIRKLLPEIGAPAPKVHAYSSTSTLYREKQKKQKRRCWEAEDFDVFRAKDVTVHLDESDLLPLLATWTFAHVFVHSLSHLSELASYVNMYCVIGINDVMKTHSRYTFGGNDKTAYVEWRPRSVLNPQQAATQSKRIAACLEHAKHMSSGWN